MYVFTGKRRATPAPVSTVGAPVQSNQGPPLSPQKDSGTSDLRALSVEWKNDPFVLPKAITDKKADQQKAKVIPRLVAIMESPSGRYAIIGGEVVKKGDRIGDEKVAEIERDRVVLVRDKAKRVLSLEDSGQ